LLEVNFQPSDFGGDAIKVYPQRVHSCLILPKQFATR
jgi:hypothetical protein